MVVVGVGIMVVIGSVVSTGKVVVGVIHSSSTSVTAQGRERSIKLFAVHYFA